MFLSQQPATLQYPRSGFGSGRQLIFLVAISGPRYENYHAIKGRLEPAFSVCHVKSAGQNFTSLVLGDHRATPAKAVVQAGLDGVLVVAEAGADDVGRSRGEGRVAE